jgi:hypothetical protein
MKAPLEGTVEARLGAFRAETTDFVTLISRIPAAIVPDGEAALAALEAEFLYERESPTRAWQREAGLILAAAFVITEGGRPLGPWQERLTWLYGFIVSQDPGDTLTDELDRLTPRLTPEDRDAVLTAGTKTYSPTNALRYGASVATFRASLFAYLGQAGSHSKWGPYTVTHAAATVVGIGAQGLPEIAEALKTATVEGAEIFAKALGKFASPLAAALLVPLLGHSSKGVKSAATLSLAELGTHAVEALKEGTASKKKAIREACEALLTAAAGAQNPFDAVLAPLSEAERSELAELAKQSRSEASRFDDGSLTPTLSRESTPYAAWVLRELLDHIGDYKYRGSVEQVCNALARSEELRPASIPLVVHFIMHISGGNNYAIEHAVRAIRPLNGVVAEALASAMAGGARPPTDFPARIRAFELLAASAAKVPTTFWLEALGDASKTIRGFAAEALHGRDGVAPGAAAHLVAKKADIRGAVAEFLAAEAQAGAGEALRGALAAEKDAKVSALLEKALAAVPDGAPPAASGFAAVPGSGPPVPVAAAAVEEIHALLAAQKKGKLPKFLSTVSLPPLVTLSGKTLNEAETLALLTRLSNEAADLEDPVARAARRALTEASAHAFGDAIYEAWLGNGRDSKQKWAVFQLGVFGSPAKIDDVGMRLGVEASTGGHHYVGWCLEAFARHGRAVPTASAAIDAGLSWIAYWARAATTDGLGGRARDLVSRERDGRKLDTASFAACINRFIASEAADRAIPVFDLAVTFRFKESTYAPVVVDAAGPSGKKVYLRGGDDPNGLLAAVPKKGAKEDKDAYTAEKNRFEELAARVERLLIREADRLEQAMVGGRIWPAPLFLALAAHPLAQHLFTGLVLSVGGVGTPPLLFRGTIDPGAARGSFVSVDYGDVSKEAILAKGVVTVPHRIAFSEADRVAWSEHFAESKLIPPFEQLGRELYIDVAELTIDTARKMKPAALAARLFEAKWQHGRPEDAGIFYESWRLFPGFGVRAVLHHGGLAISGGQSWQTEPIGLRSLAFEDLSGGRCEPAEVAPVVRSEVARDLKAILR